MKANIIIAIIAKKERFYQTQKKTRKKWLMNVGAKIGRLKLK